MIDSGVVGRNRRDEPTAKFRPNRERLTIWWFDQPDGEAYRRLIIQSIVPIKHPAVPGSGFGAGDRSRERWSRSQHKPANSSRRVGRPVGSSSRAGADAGRSGRLRGPARGRRPRGRPSGYAGLRKRRTALASHWKLRGGRAALAPRWWRPRKPRRTLGETSSRVQPFQQMSLEFHPNPGPSFVAIWREVKNYPEKSFAEVSENKKTVRRALSRAEPPLCSPRERVVQGVPYERRCPEPRPNKNRSC